MNETVIVMQPISQRTAVRSLIKRLTTRL